MSSKDEDRSIGDAASTAASPSRQRTPARDANGRDGHVGAALRSAYDEAVREEIPNEFLDLLGKLA